MRTVEALDLEVDCTVVPIWADIKEIEKDRPNVDVLLALNVYMQTSLATIR